MTKYDKRTLDDFLDILSDLKKAAARAKEATTLIYGWDNDMEQFHLGMLLGYENITDVITEMEHSSNGKTK